MRGKKQAPYAPLFPYLELTAGAVLAAGELIVDNFAGGGGASTGIEQAMGRPVDIAINHDAQALAMHAKNHPYTDHHCESVWDVDPHEVTAGRPVALAWFSPDCKHFSKAKGGKPVSKEIRGLAWVELRWAATVRPRVMITENVEEFKTWGPLGADGKPDDKQKGRTFNAWVNALKRHGYEVEWRELRACDYGAPTIRKRLFIIARCDGLPIVWPEQTHATPADLRVKSGQLLPWRTAAECLDWELPVPTIFGRNKPLVLGTCNRISQGILRFTLQAEKPFIVTCNHSGAHFRGQAVDEPMKTITAAHDAHGLVMVTAQMMQDNGGKLPAENAVYPVTRPLRTVTAQGGRQNLITGHLTAYYGKPKVGSNVDLGQRLDVPMRTIRTTEGFGLTTACIDRQFKSGRCHSLEEPMRTVMTEGGGKSNLVETTLVPALDAEQLAGARRVYAFLKEYLGAELDPHCDHQMQFVTLELNGDRYVMTDICMRMLTPRELYRAQGFPETYLIDYSVKGKPLPKKYQVKMCGNSVPPPFSKAIAHANLTALPEQQAAD